MVEEEEVKGIKEGEKGEDIKDAEATAVGEAEDTKAVELIEVEEGEAIVEDVDVVAGGVGRTRVPSKRYLPILLRRRSRLTSHSTSTW